MGHTINDFYRTKLLAILGSITSEVKGVPIREGYFRITYINEIICDSCYKDLRPNSNLDIPKISISYSDKAVRCYLCRVYVTYNIQLPSEELEFLIKEFKQNRDNISTDIWIRAFVFYAGTAGWREYEILDIRDTRILKDAFATLPNLMFPEFPWGLI